MYLSLAVLLTMNSTNLLIYNRITILKIRINSSQEEKWYQVMVLDLLWNFKMQLHIILIIKSPLLPNYKKALIHNIVSQMFILMHQLVIRINISHIGLNLHLSIWADQYPMSRKSNLTVKQLIINSLKIIKFNHSSQFLVNLVNLTIWIFLKRISSIVPLTFIMIKEKGRI